MIAAMTNYPYVVTVLLGKRGVGKTTLATNLAIFLKALDEELPVSIFSFDNHFTVDKMFHIKGQPCTGDVADFLQGTPGGRSPPHRAVRGKLYPLFEVAQRPEAFLKGPLMLARLLAVSGSRG